MFCALEFNPNMAFPVVYAGLVLYRHRWTQSIAMACQPPPYAICKSACNHEADVVESLPGIALVLSFIAGK